MMRSPDDRDCDRREGQPHHETSDPDTVDPQPDERHVREQERREARTNRSRGNIRNNVAEHREHQRADEPPSYRRVGDIDRRGET